MKLRSGWPLALFVVLIIAVPIFEVYVLVQVSHIIGRWQTVLILVAEAILGGWLLRREGARAWRALDAAFRGGRIPTGELADAALVLVGGVLLMLPGFVTDVLGLFFLIPFTRPFARQVVAFFVARRLKPSRPGARRSGPVRAGDRRGGRGRPRRRDRDREPRPDRERPPPGLTGPLLVLCSPRLAR